MILNSIWLLVGKGFQQDLHAGGVKAKRKTDSLCVSVSLPVCVCVGVCAGACACTWEGICICVSVWRSEADIRCLPLPLSTVVETEPLPEPRAHPLAGLAGQWSLGLRLSPPPSCYPSAEVKGVCHHSWPFMLGSTPRSSQLCSKNFTNWAVSSVLGYTLKMDTQLL